MSDGITITLPWPPAELSPNARLHWAKLAKAKKAYKAACMWQAKSQGLTAAKADRLHLHLVFHKPSRRAMDLDNALARMKAGLDGLSEILNVDDSQWTLSIEFAAEIGGMVKVNVREVA